MPATLLSSRRDDNCTTLSFRRSDEIIPLMRKAVKRLGWDWGVFTDFSEKTGETIVLKRLASGDDISQYERDGESADLFIGRAKAFIVYRGPVDRHQPFIDAMLANARWVKVKPYVPKRAVKKRKS